MRRGGFRALVLGSGGATGIAWQAGILAELAAAGVAVEAADRVVGTSARAVVGALTGGVAAADLAGALLPRITTIGRLTPPVVGLLAAAQLPRDRAAALRRLHRVTDGRARLPEDEWVRAVAGDLAGLPWPDRLLITAVDAQAGRGVVWSAADGVDLARAVAASCAVPGVFPAVRIGGVPHVDGGLRSLVNADLAAGCSRVVVLAR